MPLEPGAKVPVRRETEGEFRMADARHVLVQISGDRPGGIPIPDRDIRRSAHGMGTDAFRPPLDPEIPLRTVVTVHGHKPVDAMDICLGDKVVPQRLGADGRAGKTGVVFLGYPHHRGQIAIQVQRADPRRMRREWL